MDTLSFIIFLGILSEWKTKQFLNTKSIIDIKYQWNDRHYSDCLFSVPEHKWLWAIAKVYHTKRSILIYPMV